MNLSQKLTSLIRQVLIALALTMVLVTGFSAPSYAATGTVKWFNSEKGFGFITPDSGEPDVYVHYSGIVSSGSRYLEENERVKFDITNGIRGLQADHVIIIDEAPITTNNYSDQ